MAMYVPKNSILTIAGLAQSVRASNFNENYGLDSPRKVATPSQIVDSLAALPFDRPSFVTVLTKIMMIHQGQSFMHCFDNRPVSDSFNDSVPRPLLARHISFEVEPRRFDQYDLQTFEPLGIRCSIHGCSVRDFFRLLPELRGSSDSEYCSSFLHEASLYISSWKNNDNKFFFDIVYNHRRDSYSSNLIAAEETGKAFFPGGYVIGNTSDRYMVPKLRPHAAALDCGSISKSLSYRERNRLRMALTRKSSDSSLIFSPPESGHLWSSCHIDRKITDLTLNEGRMTEADLSLIAMAGIKDELLLDMPYDLSKTRYF